MKGLVRSTRFSMNSDVGRFGQKHGRGWPALLSCVCLRATEPERSPKLTTQFGMRLLLQNSRLIEGIANLKGIDPPRRPAYAVLLDIMRGLPVLAEKTSWIRA